MSLQTIDLIKKFETPLAQLFEHLSEHENLSTLFWPAKVSRLNDGTDCRNGVGSRRRLRVPLTPLIEETVTVYQQNQRIEYQVTNRTAIKNHLGIMQFSSLDSGSQLHYVITFESRIPLAGGLIKAALERSIIKGLKQIA